MNLTYSIKQAINLVCFLCIYTDSFAQAVSNKIYGLLNKEFSEANAFNTTSFVEKRWRIAGNPHFDECIYYVENILKNAGFVNEESNKSNHSLTYRIERYKKQRPSWQPLSGKLYLNEDLLPLLDFDTNKNMIAINSASANDIGEIVDIGNGSEQYLQHKNLEGKILLGTGSLRQMHGLTLKHKALGFLTYSIPSYNKPEVYTKSISFSSIPYVDSTHNKWCVLLSYEAYQKIKSSLVNGNTTARVQLKTSFYTHDDLTIIADIQGKTKPTERFVYSAHVQEPGANDNATGVGTLAEMARVLARLVQNKTYIPDRSISLIWGDEIVSTRRYIQNDTVRQKGILWGLSLDMVGEDIHKTGGTFLIEKMPDPSAIWTRGEDKHTEWGGSPLKESDMFPHYFNDLLINRCKQQAKFTNWIVNTNPFEGGSDHTPFLDAHIPGLLMWHFTDVYYHTDGDRIDKVSALEMKNVGVSALATSMFLCKNSKADVLKCIKEITTNASQRLQTELQISRENIKKSISNKNVEQLIINTWLDYYVKTLDTMQNIYTQSKGLNGISKTIANSKSAIEILVKRNQL